MLFVSLLTASVLTAVFIYCPSFTAMLVVRGFTGIFVGCVDLGKSIRGRYNLSLFFFRFDFLIFFFFTLVAAILELFRDDFK